MKGEDLVLLVKTDVAEVEIAIRIEEGPHPPLILQDQATLETIDVELEGVLLTKKNTIITLHEGIKVVEIVKILQANLLIPDKITTKRNKPKRRSNLNLMSNWNLKVKCYLKLKVGFMYHHLR